MSSMPSVRRHSTGSVGPSVQTTSTVASMGQGGALRLKGGQTGEGGRAGLARFDADSGQFPDRLACHFVLDSHEGADAGGDERPRHGRWPAAVEARP